MIHSQLKRQLLNVGLIYRPTCQRHHDKEEIALHALCECEVLAELSPSPGNQLQETSTQNKGPFNKLLCFTQDAHLLRGLNLVQWSLHAHP
jgi:hypothetical protein